MDNKTILITGGTGSFGQAFIRLLLTRHHPEKVIVFSRDEWKQWEMQRSDPLFASPQMRYFLGDVRDKERLARAFNGVDYVVHAAALKQVPAAEYNPTEFIKTNVDGAMHVIDASVDLGVKRVIALSTDKAVNPVNLYGATKLCSDKLFVAANAYAGKRGYPRFSVVRYGNVLGSRGSVAAMWREQVERGADHLTVTDPRMTRFWISLEQAAEFVLESFLRMEGGEIFVPKIPSMKLVDLAEAIAPKMEKRFTGIREGEKLHELLISREEGERTYAFPTYYAISHPLAHGKLDEALEAQGGERVGDFIYASDTNGEWLNPSQICEGA
ncbi:MAG: UDP-N-acetylglucosamine 4,6-dehydratase (inverting) [Parachlamydiales bacterium]